MLICNAGIMMLPKLEQIRGVEKQFATNHVGHFLLVNRLLARVKAAPQGRIVMLSSTGHASAPNYFSDCNPKTPSPQARDGVMAERLWSVSEELVKGYL
jgi:NAD(P)-dependent dehydrogenase (short-subunit alcohol dehydrogenase family)